MENLNKIVIDLEMLKMKIAEQIEDFGYIDEVDYLDNSREIYSNLRRILSDLKRQINYDL